MYNDVSPFGQHPYLAVSSPMIESAGIVGIIPTGDRWATLIDRKEEDALASSILHRRFSTLPAERQQYLRYLPAHLMEAQHPERLSALLSNFGFFIFKLLIGTPQELIDDIDRAASSALLEAVVEDDLHRVAAALRRSSHLLSYSPGQLPEQLLGRLPPTSSSLTQALRAGASEAKQQPWFRPLTASLLSANPLMRTLVGQSGLLDAITLLGTTRTLAAANRQAIMIWDLDTGQIVRTIALGHKEDLTDLTATSDGTVLIAAFRDGTLCSWRVADGQEIHQFGSPGQAALAVAMLPDGRVVSGGTDGLLRVWDVERGTLLQTITSSAVAIHSVAVTADGTRAVSGGGSLFGGSADKHVVVWNLRDQREEAVLKGHRAPVEAVAFALDDRRIISASTDHTLRIWDASSGTLLHTLEGHNALVRAVAVSPDGRRAISAADDVLKLWNLETGRELLTLAGHTGLVSDVAITPDGRQAISASWDQTLRVWSLAAASQMESVTHGNTVEALAFSSDGQWIISASRDCTMKIWNVERGIVTHTLSGHTQRVTGVVVGTDGSYALSVGWDQTIRLWDIRIGSEIRRWTGHTKQITAVALTPDGRHAVTASKDQTLIVWNIADGSKRYTLNGHHESVTAVVIMTDGQHIVSASDDASVRVWSLASGREVRRCEGHTNRVTSLAVVDERRVLSTGWDQTVRLWDVASGSLLKTLSGSPCGLTAVATVPGGTVVLTAGGLPYLASDNTLRLWNITTGTVTARVIGDSPLTACMVNPDGTVVAVGDSLGGVHFYALDPGSSSS